MLVSKKFNNVVSSLKGRQIASQLILGRHTPTLRWMDSPLIVGSLYSTRYSPRGLCIQSMYSQYSKRSRSVFYQTRGSYISAPMGFAFSTIKESQDLATITQDVITNQTHGQQDSKKNQVRKFLKKFWAQICIFFTALWQYLTTSFGSFIDAYKKDTNEKRQINKADQAKNLIDKLQKQEHQKANIWKQLFHCKLVGQDKLLKELLSLSDNKLMVFIQTYIGSGVGNNIRKLAYELSKQHKQSGIFDKMYYINLRDPSHYSVAQDQDSKWQEARDLNLLLTSLIGDINDQLKQPGFLTQFQRFISNPIKFIQKKFQKKIQKSVLIIDQIQMIEHFMKKESQTNGKVTYSDKKKMMQQLYQKLNYVQRKKKVRIIMISNNNTFFNTMNHALDAPNLQDFRFQLISQLTDANLRNIIKTRSQIDKHYAKYQQLQKECGKHFQTLIDYIISINNNTRQIMRILKYANIDLNHKFRKQDLYQGTQDTLEKANQYIEKICEKVYKKDINNHFQFILDVKGKLLSICKNIVQHKKTSIISQLDQSAQRSHLNECERQQIVKSKIKILMLIFSGIFSQDKIKQPQFLFQMKSSDIMAYEDLNKAEIIHSLAFSSRAYQHAFYSLLTQSKKYFEPHIEKVQEILKQNNQNKLPIQPQKSQKLQKSQKPQKDNQLFNIAYNKYKKQNDLVNSRIESISVQSKQKVIQ